MKNVSLQKGFTLIEMIVSLAIFTIVALVAVGALVRITDANKKSITLKTTINNLNFALESLSREMRVGGDYYCTSGTIGSIPASVGVSSCNHLTNSWTIAFTSSKRYPPAPAAFQCNLKYAYRFYATEQTISKGEQTDCNDTIDESEFQPLISKDIKITGTIVDVKTDLTPKAFFWFTGYSGVRAKERTEFQVQTSVSQRVGGN